MHNVLYLYKEVYLKTIAASRQPRPLFKIGWGCPKMMSTFLSVLILALVPISSSQGIDVLATDYVSL